MLYLARNAMRTRWELALPLSAEQNEADVRAAGEEALQEIDKAEQMLSAFRPDSDLFRLNHQAQNGLPVSVPGALFAFLVRVQRLVAQTGGAFNPAVGPIIDLWEAASKNGRNPTPQEIAAYLPLTNRENIVLDADAQTVTYQLPGVRLNMGAIGKGWAADKAVENLRENGITSALLHGGTSTVYGLGTPISGAQEAGEKGWVIALQNSCETAYLHDAALGVSAVHGKIYGQGAGQTLGHVLDARTGWPAQKAAFAAAVCASAMEADALSTALLVLGREGDEMRAHFPDAWFCVR